MCSRLFRCLICMLLVVALIVQVSPLQAQAAAITGSAVAIGVGIGLAVAVGFQALGIRQGADGAAFSSLVSDCAAALSPEWAINGLTTMLALTNDGVTKTYASRDFLQSILDWLFDSGSLTATQEYTFPYSNNARVMECYDKAMAYPYHCVAYNQSGRYWWFFCSNYEMVFEPDTEGGYWIKFLNGDAIGYRLNGGSAVEEFYNSKGSGAGSFIKITENGLVSEISTSSDLILESVGQDIDTDYETYIDESIISVDFGIQFEDDPNTGRNEEDNNKVGWVPTRLLTSSGDTYADQTQADAQSGLTDPEIVDNFVNNSGNGSGSNSGSDSWTPPSSHMQFALGDLSKFFPFCIPFDLFDFFTLLNADPVAPVFSWEIQDLSGQTYALTIDLSEWDSVALLFRRLQLFLFICGLAAASRKFIKW